MTAHCICISEHHFGLINATGYVSQRVVFLFQRKRIYYILETILYSEGPGIPNKDLVFSELKAYY